MCIVCVPVFVCVCMSMCVLSGASSLLDAVKTSCRHFTEALQLAEDQRFAHEYGDTTLSSKHRTTHETKPEETTDMDSTSATNLTETESPRNSEEVPPLGPVRSHSRSWMLEEKSAAERLSDVPETVTLEPKKELTVCKSDSGSSISHSLATKEKAILSNPRLSLMSNPQNLDLKK